MTITLSENKKKALITFINQHFDEHMSHFPYAKYPMEPLDEWREQFANPSTIRPEKLRSALLWRCGFWQRKDAPYVHKNITITAITSWPEFTEQALTDPTKVLDYWIEKLPSDTHGFDAASYLLHLLQPNNFELVDSHRLAAMHDILKEIGHDTTKDETSPTLSDLTLYTDIFRMLLPKMKAIHGERAHVQLDRFLKVYGNRHAYKNVSAEFKVKEPIMRSFSWEGSVSKHFRLDQIVNRSNVDVLFACLLLTLEAEERAQDDLTIGEIAERLPLGTGGLCNPASFNYALVALFGGQKQRDFWQFQNPAILHSFTEQANHSTRNMRFYLTHSAEKVSINPKYVND
jgi:hypothetical protein